MGERGTYHATMGCGTTRSGDVLCARLGRRLEFGYLVGSIGGDEDEAVSLGGLTSVVLGRWFKLRLKMGSSTSEVQKGQVHPTGFCSIISEMNHE